MVWKNREVLSNIEAILMIGSLVFKLVTAKLDTQSCYNYHKKCSHSNLLNVERIHN